MCDAVVLFKKQFVQSIIKACVVVSFFEVAEELITWPVTLLSL